MVWLIIGLCVASFIILDIIMFRLVKNKIMRERKRNYFKENFDFIEKDGKIIDYKNKTKTSVYIDDKPMYQHTQVACFNIHNNEPTIIEDDEEVTSDKDNNMVYNYNHWGDNRYKIFGRFNLKVFDDGLYGKILEDLFYEKIDPKKSLIYNYKILDAIDLVLPKIAPHYESFRKQEETLYKKSVDNFIKKIKNNKDIKEIKLKLSDHGQKTNEFDMLPPAYIEYFFKKIKEENIKLPIYVKNIACYGAETASLKNTIDRGCASEYIYSKLLKKKDTKLNIKQFLENFSKENNIEIFYQAHANKQTPHVVKFLYYKKNDNRIFKLKSEDNFVNYHFHNDKNNNFLVDKYEGVGKAVFKNLLNNLVDKNDVQKIKI